MMKLFRASSRTLGSTRICMILIHREGIETIKELLQRESEQLTNHLTEEGGQVVTIKSREIALGN